MNDYELGYGTGGSLWDGIVDAAMGVAGAVNAVRGNNDPATPPASARTLPPAGNTVGGLPWYVWAGGGLLALIALLFALRK